MKCFSGVLLAMVLLLASPASRADASPVEARVRLHDGKLATAADLEARCAQRVEIVDRERAHRELDPRDLSVIRADERDHARGMRR